MPDPTLDSLFAACPRPVVRMGPRVSVIVGPAGSGKSLIANLIRGSDEGVVVCECATGGEALAAVISSGCSCGVTHVVVVIQNYDEGRAVYANGWLHRHFRSVRLIIIEEHA